ncbi:MAG: sodium-dependent transporter [Clostridium sp.]|nr:sodium-dependent transporter [Bacteroides sp.]MCM1199461.1 sodium-dependent transporter [Clostridium sp.]
MERENFGSRFGVLMAMAGSAVGLGNLWRFPYMVGTNGGAAFIFVYILSVFLLCLPILCAEAIVGRRSQKNAFRAFDSLAPGTPWKWAGIIMVLTPMIVVSYYSVIGGWSVEYFLKSLMFDFTGSAHTQEGLGHIFGDYISSVWRPLVEHTVFLGITAIVVVRGVKNGIEKFGKVMMPLLFLIVIAIAIRSLTLPGAGEGLSYLFRPDFSKIDGPVCMAALGQAFFSLSVGFGIMMTYSSYISKKENIAASSSYTAIADFIFALIASCAIMPAVFSFGLSPQAGPGLVFETLPFIFSKMPMGGVIAILFFLALLVAALTSSISIFEVGVAYLVEERNMTRKAAALIVYAITWSVGIVCSLSFGPLSDFHIFGETVFNLLDKLSANLLMTTGALTIVLFVGWKMKRSDVMDEFTNGGTLAGNRRIFPYLYFVIRYLAPAAIVMVLISGLFL